MVEAITEAPVYDVLVLGGGFGGLHMVHELRERGFSVIGLEAGDNVGGAWYWNRYPGARCDVESLAYCYSFSPIIDKEWKGTVRAGKLGDLAPTILTIMGLPIPPEMTGEVLIK